MKRCALIVASLLLASACGAVTTGVKTPPGGANKSVQFNDNNVFGSSPTFSFVKASGLLSTPHVEVDTMTVYGAQVWRDQKAPGGSFFVHDFDNYITLTPSYVDADSGNILKSTCSLTQPRAWTIGSYNKDSTESNVWSMGANNNVINFTRTYKGTQQSYFGVGYEGYTIVNSSGVKNLSNDSKATFMIFGSTPIGDPLLGIYGDNGEAQLGPTKIQTLLFQVHQSSISAMEPMLMNSSATVHGQLQATTLKFPDGTTMTTAATGTGSSGPFTNATSSTSIDLNGFAINNSSAVTTSSMSVTGATITVNGTAFNFVPRTEITGTGVKLFQYDPTTNAVTFPDAITTGVTTGGTAGSTTTMTSDLIMNTLSTSALVKTNSSKQLSSVSNTGADGTKFLRDDFTWAAAGSGSSPFTSGVATGPINMGGFDIQNARDITSTSTVRANNIITTYGVTASSVTVGTMTVTSTMTVSNVDGLTFTNANFTLAEKSHIVQANGQNLDDRWELYMTSDTATTGAALQNGQSTMNFAVKSGGVYVFRYTLNMGCNNTGGIKIGINGPGSSTVRAVAWGDTTATAPAESLLTAMNTASAAFVTTSRATGTLTFYGTFTAGGDGTVTLQYQSTTATQTTTMYAASSGSAKRVQ